VCLVKCWIDVRSDLNERDHISPFVPYPLVWCALDLDHHDPCSQNRPVRADSLFRAVPVCVSAWYWTVGNVIVLLDNGWSTAQLRERSDVTLALGCVQNGSG
jgi:hypothetical protein